MTKFINTIRQALHFDPNEPSSNLKEDEKKNIQKIKSQKRKYLKRTCKKLISTHINNFFLLLLFYFF